MRTILRVGDPDINPYQLMTALIVPRPIAWISTVSADGVGNLAPHSFFSVASADPATVSFTSVGDKDTLANVLATGEFVINVASRRQLDLVNNSSARFAPDEDEASALEIEMEPSELVRPPRVADAPAAIECALHSTQRIGSSTLVLGTVVAFAIKTEVLVDGHPEMAGLEPVSRLGKDEWGMPPEVRATPRPQKPEDIRR